jgi:apolipoprotein N-acyltransferase
MVRSSNGPATTWLSARARNFLWSHTTWAFAAGGTTTLAFSPFDLYPLALASLSLLFWLWHQADASKAFRLGWMYGAGLLGFGVFWLHISINLYGNMGRVPAIAITLLFVAAMSLYYGVAGWLAKQGSAGDDTALLLAYPAAWVLLEWLRGWFLSGFPWLSLGYTLIDSPLRGFAPLAGVYGLSWLLALSASLCVLLLTRRGLRRTYAGIALATVWTGGALLGMVDWTSPAGRPIRASLIQGNVAQSVKWLPEQLQPTLALYRGLTEQHWESDLIIWPETAVPAFYHRVEKGFLTPLEAEASARGTELLLGLPVRDSDGRGYFNSMLRLGSSRDAYHKRHLVPFGEFVPLDSLLRPVIDRLGIPMSDFSSGPADKTGLELAGYPAALSICYEDAFGDETIQALPEAAFLVNASNDAWFGDSLAPHQHLQIARMRAVETGRPMLRATNTGISAIIGPRGNLLGHSPAFATTVLTGEIIPRQGATPYALTGNTPLVILMFALLSFAAWRKRQPQSVAGR